MLWVCRGYGQEHAIGGIYAITFWQCERRGDLVEVCVVARPRRNCDVGTTQRIGVILKEPLEEHLTCTRPLNIIGVLGEDTPGIINDNMPTLHDRMQFSSTFCDALHRSTVVVTVRSSENIGIQDSQ